MTQYLIPFDDGAMTFPDEELPDGTVTGGPYPEAQRRFSFLAGLAQWAIGVVGHQ